MIICFELEHMCMLAFATKNFKESTIIAHKVIDYFAVYFSLSILLKTLNLLSSVKCPVAILVNDTAGFHLEILVWGGSGCGSSTHHCTVPPLPLILH